MKLNPPEIKMDSPFPFAKATLPSIAGRYSTTAAGHPRVSICRLVLAAGMLVLSMTTTHSAHAEGEKESISPLPSLNTVEECQRADLQRYLGKTFRFHHGACWADVSIDENGKITSFIPEDEAACREALKVNCGWISE